jgi:hypothetical protein
VSDEDTSTDAVLPDGDHDVFVVDATAVDDTPEAWILELTVVSGPHKGEVVTVRANNLTGSEFDLLGMPGTLTVRDGQPSMRIDT